MAVKISEWRGVRLVLDPALVDPQHPVEDPDLLHVPLGRAQAKDPNPLAEDGLLKLVV